LNKKAILFVVVVFVVSLIFVIKDREPEKRETFIPKLIEALSDSTSADSVNEGVKK